MALDKGNGPGTLSSKAQFYVSLMINFAGFMNRNATSRKGLS